MKLIYPAILLCSVIVALSSCSSEKNKVEAVQEEETEAVEEQVSSVESGPREPIYVYGKHPEKDTLKEVILRLNAEPVLLPVHRSPEGEGGASGYVRLVGVVSGGRPLALVELGGKGLGVGIGEEFAGYRIASISSRKIILKRKGEN
jgi:hypothetical protein